MAEIYRSDIVRVDLDHALLRKHVGAILVTGDKLGNRFGAEVFRDGNPVDVTGCGVTAYFLRPGEDAIVLNGTASGSVAYVDLAQACYSKASSFTLTIKISYGGTTTALRVIDGYILLTQTDDLVDPGEVVPTLDDLLAQIEAMEQGTAAAENVVAEYEGKVAEQDASIAALSEEKVSKVEAIIPDYPTLFDPRNVIQGYWYEWETGKVAESSDRFIQPIVPCEPSTVYTKDACNVSMYDANKAYISTVIWSDPNTFTTPENAAYFGVSMTISNLAAVKLVKGDTVPAVQPVAMLSPSQVVGLPDAMSAVNNSFQFMGQVEAGNYTTLLPDANNAGNGFYIINLPYGSEDIPGNLPMTVFTGRMDLLESYVNKDGYRRQIYYHYHNVENVKVYTRGGVSAYSWDEWELVVDEPRAPIIVDKNGGGDYTSLTQAMRENVGAAYEFHVRPGTYDLIEEMKAYHGTGYFDNPDIRDEGLVINHGVKVFLDANAIVKFDYAGSNSNVIEYFSPFKFSGIGGELHGGQIVCSNCRYAIHDDCYTSAYDNRVTDGVHIYYRSDRDVAIGGGLGISSHVELKNCYVDSGDTGYGVFYHNNAESDAAKNFVSIHDNYFTAGVVIESFGPSPLMSRAIVSNNKAEYVRHVQPSAADNPPNINNFEMVAWNNETKQ